MVVIEIIGGTLLLMSALAFLLLAVLDLAMSRRFRQLPPPRRTLWQLAPAGSGAITARPGTTIRPVRHLRIKSKVRQTKDRQAVENGGIIIEMTDTNSRSLVLNSISACVSFGIRRARKQEIRVMVNRYGSPYVESNDKPITLSRPQR